MFKNFRYALAILTLVSICSCSNQIINPTIYNTTEQLQLGEIGEDNNYVLEKSYSHTAIPSYHKPVRVNVQVQDFKSSSYKAFQKAAAKQNESTVDSTVTISQYLKLDIADRVAVLNALNGKDNEDVKRYLNNKYDTHLISSITIVFPKQIQDIIMQADEVFLKTHGIKSYALYLYKESVLVDTIPFTDGVVFNYKTSNFCWKETKYAKWDMVDVVDNFERCPKGTYRSPKKDKGVKEYLRF